ncbi:Transposon Tf2-11 polyprotein [Nosema granulosis]|uniref:Transposon Tf2-11 polyprotein n=1 Tax=Nosema granulosis TaxID=83296 RepID=A0A9P6GXE7_9MICR|nr:Transposon Tf2-11 polyprotein [Nosema granulosis]
MMGIIKALEYFRGMLFGRFVKIYTDNINCIHRPKNPRMKRWNLLLKEYNFELISIKGEENSMADTLSRCLSIKKIDSTTESQLENYINELDKYMDKTEVYNEDKRLTLKKKMRG